MSWEIDVLLLTMLGAIAGGHIAIFGIGGLIHWNWFVRKKEQKAEWKIQPKRWPSDKKVKEAVKWSSLNLIFGGISGALLSTHFATGGWSMLRMNFSDLPIIWHVISFFLCLLMMDAYLYYSHRMLHTKPFYKRFHLLHHRWVDPHIFTTVAMHPVEFFFFQTGLILPMFILPQFWGVYIAAVLYTLIIGMIDHSGIKIKMPWWTFHDGDNTFHDEHHMYYHVNFGHHTGIWDKLHGTVRKVERKYGEDVYGGFGKKA